MRIPLRPRLTLVFSIGTAIVLAGLGLFAYTRMEADLLDSVDAGLRSRAQLVENGLVHAGSANLASSEGKLIDPDEAFAQILDESGRIVETTSAVSGAPLLTADEVAALAGLSFVTRQMADLRKYEIFDDPVRLLALAPVGSLRRVVVVGATLSDVNEALERLLELLAAIGTVAILLMAGAGWLLAGAALRPVEQMRQEAAAVSASEPGRRLPVPRTADELARLAITLNSMLDRLQEALERERRLVDNASHELRTPLATLRAEIDLALVRQRDAAELEASLRSAQEDVNHLQRLVEDLLVMARSRGGRIPVRRVRTRLAPLVDKVLQFVHEQASEAGVAIDVEVIDAAVELDLDRVQQALRNLLENSIRHTPRGGGVRVGADRTGDMVRIVVADSGPGFPPDALAAIFDPFVRAGAAKPGPNSTGLGLAIVRAVAEAHGGSASAENTPQGARVTLRVHM